MNKMIDVTGNKYGKLLVLEYIGNNKYICKCDCGNEIIKNKYIFTKGWGQHCGCSPKLMIDLKDKRFGKLVAIRKINTSWECMCDCGRIAIVSGHKLRKGIQESCGCLFYFHEDREAAKIRLVYIGYKKGATKRGLQFSLEEVVFKELILSSCHYCGIEWSNQSKDNKRKKDSNFIFRYNGLDRVDNNKGYIKNNVVPCCNLCNLFKRTMDTDTFMEWIFLVYHNFANNFIFPDLDIHKNYNNKKHFQVDKLTNSMFRRLFTQQRHTAEKRRELKWNIKLNLYFYLIFQECYYCGRTGISKLRHRSKELYRYYNGIDRIDNTKDYTWDNIITSCIDCNSAKKELTLEDFRQKVIDIYSNLVDKTFKNRVNNGIK